MVTTLTDQIFENIVETIHEPLLVLDSDLKVIIANRSFINSFKVTREKTLGNFIYDLGNKQWDIPKLRELLETILPQQTSFDNYEVEHDFATIGKRVMLLNARQIERGMDKERIILLAIEDITKRKEIEAGLEKTRKELAIIKKTADEAHEFAESIINTVSESLISLDQDLRVVTVSRSFYDLFKVKPEETVGQLIYDLGNKQWDIPKLRELLETILPEKTAFDNYEVEHDFAAIGRRVMLLNARQIEQTWGKERIILLAIEDITERKQADQALQDSEAKFRNLFQNHSAAKLIIDPDTGNIVEANRSAEIFYGWSVEQLKEMRIQDINTLSNEQVKAEMEKARLLERTYFEFRHRLSDGSFKEVGVYSCKVDIKRKALLHSIIHDISKRKRTEEQKDRLVSDLQKALSEVKTLRGFLPICSNCKKIRDDKGYWNQIESYIRDRSDAEFSHGICPECAKKLYPDMNLYEEDAK
ncbi:MAG: PAS domain-containing protein [Desulfobacterales bacterium]|nr:PAS domain-containing protein [Desulfobacterales bacterium]